MKVRWIIFLLITLSFWDCSYPEVKLEKQGGQVNKVKAGEKFRISLPEDHNTKYLWTLKKDIPTTYVDYMGSVFHGTYVDYNFTAVRPGKEELTLYLYSPRDTAEIKTFVVEVE